jgi:DNA-binding beta-propeller fold protein YncE
MRSTIVFVLVVAAAAWAQPYEFDIPLPDSLGGIGCPWFATYAPAVGRVYICGPGLGGVIAIDDATSQKVRRIPTTYGGGLFYYPSNNRVYIDNNAVTVVDCSTNMVVDTIALGYQGGAIGALNPVTGKLYSISSGQPIVVLDCNGDSVLRTIPAPGSLEGLAVSTISNKVYAVDHNNARLVVVDGSADTICGYVAVNGLIGRLCYNPAMDRLYVTGGNRGMSVVDCSTDRVVDTVALRREFEMAWCPSGNKLYCPVREVDSVYVVDCGDNSIVERLSTPDDPRYPTYDSTTNTMYVSCNASNKVAIVDCNTDSVAAVASVASGPAWGCSSLDGGRMYITGARGHAVSVFDCASRSVTATLATGEGIGRALYAGGEGKLYCFETDSAELAVCDTQTRQAVSRLAIGSGIDNFVYDRSRAKLFCGGDSGLAVVNTVSDSVLMTRRGFGARAICLDQAGGRVFFSPSRSSGSKVRVLDAATNELADSATIFAPGLICFDPLTNRLWCQTTGAIAVFECDSGLRQIGSTPRMESPTWNPWDGLVYGLDTLGIWGYDPVTLDKIAGASYRMVAPWNNMAFNAAGDRCYFYDGSGSTGQWPLTLDCRSRHINSGPPVIGYPTDLDFAAAGRRVWAMSAGYTAAYGESLENGHDCHSVDATIRPVTCDAVLGRTFMSDINYSRVVVFRDTMQDSLDVACTRVVGPRLRPDTGAPVSFRTVLVNCGSAEKTCNVKLRVTPTDNPRSQWLASYFEDSTSVFLGGCGWSAVAFDTWRPTTRGLYAVEAIAAWPGDEVRSNDTARCLLRVGTLCIDVSPRRIVAPTGTVDSGTSVIPKSWIVNRGAVAVSCQAQMSIGAQYEDEKPTGVIAPGDSHLVSFASWSASELGVLSVRCSTMLADDSVPQNDLLRGTVTVQRTGGVEETVAIPATFFIAEWTPNPVRSAARLSYGLSRAAEVRLSIYSVDGRQTRVLVDGARPAGYYWAYWDSRDDAGRICVPGVYFCRAEVGPLQKSHKLTVTY